MKTKKTKKKNKTKKRKKTKYDFLFKQFIELRKKIKDPLNNDLYKLYQSVKKWENYKIVKPLGWKIDREDTCNEYNTITIFQKYVEYKKYRSVIEKYLVYEDKKIMVFTPHDKDGIKSNNYLKSSEIKDINSSKIHYLAIPKKRLWNIVTIKKSDIPLLEHCQNVLKKLIKLALRSNNSENNENNEILNEKTLYNHYNNMNDCNKKRISMLHGQNISEYDSKLYHENNIETSVHIFPMATVYWLHIHGYVKSLNTIKNNVFYYKQLRLDKIIKYLKNEKYNNKKKTIKLCSIFKNKKKKYINILNNLDDNFSII